MENNKELMTSVEHTLVCRFCDKPDVWVHLSIWKGLSDEDVAELPQGLTAKALAQHVENVLRQKNKLAN
jgi:hypothetical protein